MTPRKLLAIAIAAVLCLAVPARAETEKAIFVSAYDLDAISTTYCVTSGQGGDPFGKPYVVTTVVSTSGSSTTITATTASTNPFTDVAVGDVLIFQPQPDAAPSIRYVTARASADSITVNSAITLTAVPFRWLDVTCGTAATDGWIGVRGWTTKKLVFALDQVNVTGGVSVVWECRDETRESTPVRLYPDESADCGTGGTLSSGFCNFTAAGIDSRFFVSTTTPWDACRIGFKIGSADDGGDLTTNAESITATLYVER